MPMLALLLVLAALFSGCQSRTALGVAETVIGLHSAAGAYATDLHMPQACLWLVGRIGPMKGLVMVLAHGGAEVEECVRLWHIQDPPAYLPPSPPSPER